MRYYLWGLQIEKGASQEDPGGRMVSDVSGPETEVQKAKKIREEGALQDVLPILGPLPRS